MRVIIHVDMDCFYAAVERVRLHIPKDQPLGVQQWHSLIAVDYEARKKGVKRGATVKEAQRACPGITLVHVDTIGKEGSAESDRENRKVSLERYRDASDEIMKLLGTLTDGVVERASIDEAYLDVSEACQAQDQTLEALPHLDEAWKIEGPGTLDMKSKGDRLLAIGASIALSIRSQVEDTLGYPVSAGIAHNKMLAKIGSTRNKPNGQAIIPTSSVAGLLAEIPLRQVNGLRGKLGEHVEQWSKCTFLPELQDRDLAELVAEFGERTGRWLDEICRGLDSSEVTVASRANTMNCAKQFTTKATKQEVLEEWLPILCQELFDRLVKDEKRFSRKAKSLNAAFLSGNIRRSKVLPMPSGVQLSVFQLQRAFKPWLADMCSLGRCGHLTLGASSFEDLPKNLITSFFESEASAPERKEKDEQIGSRLIEKEGKRKAVVLDDGDGRGSNDVDVDDDGKTVCTTCGEVVDEAATAEHLDWHLAQKLQGKYTREEEEWGWTKKARGSGNGSRSKATKGRGKGKSKGSARDKNERRIDSFFSA
ncbi:unnamed protein product [Chrysoparadoxa australica]